MKYKLLAFVFLNVIDQMTTYAGMLPGVTEGNLVFSWLFRTIGFGWSTVIKVVLAAALGLLLMAAIDHWPEKRKGIHLLMDSLCVAYVLAVVNNLFALAT